MESSERPGPKLPPDTNQEQTSSGKPSLRNRIKNTPLRTKIALAGAAGLSLAAAALGIHQSVNETLGGDDTPKEPVAGKITTPTPSKEQVVEIPPTPVTTLEATPQPTVTPVEPTSIKVPKNWPRPEVDPEVTGPSHFRTVEQDISIVKDVESKFPYLVNVRAILVSGTESATVFPPNPNDPVVVYLGRDAYDLQRKAFNELGSIFDIKMDYSRLAPHFTQEQIQQLQNLRSQIINKYRNFPSIQKMFSPNKLGDNRTNLYTAYPDSIFIRQSYELKTPEQTFLYPLQEPLFKPYLDTTLIEKFSQEISPTQIGYLNFPQFYHAQKDQMEMLKSSSPFHKLALTILEENMDVLANWQWASTQNVRLYDKYLANYMRDILPTYEFMALAQAVGNNDSRLAELPLTPDQLQDIRSNYAILFEAASDETFAVAYEQQEVGQFTDDLTANYHSIICSAAN